MDRNSRSRSALMLESDIRRGSGLGGVPLVRIGDEPQADGLAQASAQDLLDLTRLLLKPVGKQLIGLAACATVRPGQHQGDRLDRAARSFAQEPALDPGGDDTRASRPEWLRSRGPVGGRREAGSGAAGGGPGGPDSRLWLGCSRCCSEPVPPLAL